MGAGCDPDDGPVTVIVEGQDELPDLPRKLGLAPAPVLVSVGGAGSMSDDVVADVERLLGEEILPLLRSHGAVVVDGGTASGVMAAMGRVREATGGHVPLVGVAARGTVRAPGSGRGDAAADLDPRHSHQVLVPGEEWGDESPWLARVATVIAGPHPSVTLVVNGGEITYQDMAHSLQEGRPVIVVSGTGRTADAVASARSDPDAAQDPRAGSVASLDLVEVVAMDDPARLASSLRAALRRD